MLTEGLASNIPLTDAIRFSILALGFPFQTDTHVGIWHGIVWYGIVWYGMVRYGMVWYGMVGMVWYGMVWYGLSTPAL